MQYGSTHSILISFPHLVFNPGGNITISPSITAEVIS